MAHVVVVHYHEIGLKGRNRAFFERALARNLLEAVQRVEPAQVRVERGRLLILTDSPPGEELLAQVGATFGVQVYAPARDVDASIESMARSALDLLSEVAFERFAIAARRATKEHPMTSMQINSELGEVVRTSTQARVDLRHPDVVVHVEVKDGRALVYLDRRRGPGGLPVGVSGRVMVMLSGGIDSAVAAYRVLKRGARASLCHFHSAPFTDRAGVRKARELAETVSRWQGATTLYAVPFGNAQQQIVVAAPPALRVVLYRRFMYRVAAALARAEGGKALVTGDSLGQVASQTLENMIAIDEATDMLVLRPLVGEDKAEIVDEAKRIGTYETSILPYQDCCSLFVPRSPATRARVADCRAAEARLDVDGMVASLVEAAEVDRIEPSSRPQPSLQTVVRGA